MQIERPLLTIAIPTYNRSKYLGRLLSGLMPQVTGEPRVEVIVSDNASPDDTEAVVRSFRRDDLQMVCIRNEVNRGPDANFLQCFERARGKYVWIVGDDDVLAPKAIEKIIKYLSREEYDLVYVSSREIRNSQPEPPPARSKPASVFHAPEALACRVHIFFTFMSGNIVNKDRISSAAHPPFSDLVGTNLIQLGWVYTALNGHRRSLFIHEPLVGMTINNTGGYGLFTVFGANLTRITGQWLRSERVKRTIINGTLQTFFPTYLLAAKKANGSFVEENPARVLRPVFGANFRYWLFDFPLIVLPLPLARLWLLAVRCVNKADALVGRPLLR